MRALALAVFLGAVACHAQPFFIEDFENPTARLDAGGVWSEIYDVLSTRQTLAHAAHRGAGGFRVQRINPIPTAGTDTQLERVMPTVNAGEWWVRWWMRIDATQLGPQALMNFGDTNVPNHIGLAHDPAGLFVTGYESTGGFFADRAGDRPDAGWHLYEFGVFGMATPDGGVRLIIDGETALSRRAMFDFSDAGRHQVNLGLTFASPQTFVGVIDYDDFRAHRSRPTGTVRVAGLSGPWRAGECVQLRVDFAPSDRSLQRPAEIARTVTLSTTPSLPIYSDSSCMTPSAILTFPASSITAEVAFIRPPAAGTYLIDASEPDLLSGSSLLQVQEALDAGPPDGGGVIVDGGADAGARDAGSADGGVDAGGPDAGGADAGGADAGGPDAGEDAGVDAGLIDAGEDAGLDDAGLSLDAGPDAGSPDAGSPDGGVNADAGHGPVELAVGCGCGHLPGESSWLVVAALVFISRRLASGAERRANRS